MALTATSSYLQEPPGLKGRIGSFHSATLTGDITLDATYPNTLKLDPGGSARNIALPTAANFEGVTWRIINAADTTENLVVKEGSTTIGTINQNEQGEFYCDGSSWALVCITTIALS